MDEQTEILRYCSPRGMADFEDSAVVTQELVDGEIHQPVVVKAPPRNAPKGPTDAAELILLHGKERSNKLQSLRVTRNAAVKIVKKNTAKLREACQSVLSLHEDLGEIKPEDAGDDQMLNSASYQTDANSTRARLCVELDEMVSLYKTYCVSVRNEARAQYGELFRHAAVVGFGACAPSTSYQTFEWEHTKLTAFAAEFKEIFHAMYSNSSTAENRLKPKGLANVKKRSREEEEEMAAGAQVDRVDKLKRARRSAFETRSRVNEALKRQTIRLFERLESIADMLNWSSISSNNHSGRDDAFDLMKAQPMADWAQLQNLTQQIADKCKDLRDECRLSNPEILAKPAVSVFAASGPCSDFKEYNFLNSNNPYFDSLLCSIFKWMFTNEIKEDNSYAKKVGRPRVHQGSGAGQSVAGVENLISMAGGGATLMPQEEVNNILDASS